MKILTENPLLKDTDIRMATMTSEIELFNDSKAKYAELWMDENITAEANRAYYNRAIFEMEISGIGVHVRKHKVYAVKEIS